MDEQSVAMTQLSEATLASSKALEQIADASYEQVSLHTVINMIDKFLTEMISRNALN